MLEIEVPEMEYFDDATSLFVKRPGKTLRFEHSLLSVSKWEARFEKAFLNKADKTPEEMLNYIQCMRLDLGPIADLYPLTKEHFVEINEYMNTKATATTFQDRTSGRQSKEVITSELMYYWMTAYQIPFECETWHLNRLMALIKICSIKNAPQKKMRRSEILARNRALNEQRLAKYNTSG